MPYLSATVMMMSADDACSAACAQFGLVSATSTSVVSAPFALAMPLVRPAIAAPAPWATTAMVFVPLLAQLLLRRLNPDAGVWISDPSWENHQQLFDYAGFKVQSYPYYDPATHGLGFDAMMDTLKKLPAGAITVLHACCHNPTGLDLSPDQWERVIERRERAGPGAVPRHRVPGFR